jgi:hypothetical protein
MDKKLDTLYDLCETVSKELESANEKINGSGGELSAGDLEYLDKLTHTMKSLKTTIAMIEAEDGHSGYYMGGRYYYDNDMPMDGRGGRSNARGGRGSYARHGSYARGGRGYSRDDAREDFIDEIEELIEKAPDEHTRKKFERFLSEMK